MTPAASSRKADSSEKKPAKASVKVFNKLSCCNWYSDFFVVVVVLCSF